MALASKPAASGAPGSRDAFEEAWRRQQPWWHAMYAIVWIVGLVATLLGEPGPRGRAIEIACVVVLLAAYLGLGMRALRVEGTWYGLTYHAISWSCILLLQYLNPTTGTWVFFFALFPHLWAMLTVRQATIGTVVAVTAFALVRWEATGFDVERVPDIVVSSVISIGLSLALGLFINRMVSEAQSRATIIDELRIAQAQLAAIERDRGIHEERERLAREIHDTLAQGFTSVLALARAAEAALGRGDVATALERLTLLRSTAADNLSEARLIVAETTPGHLHSRTLVEALDRLVAAVRAEADLDARLEVHGTPTATSVASDVVLLRAAQESLANVRRHAKASAVTVSLHYTEGAPTVLRVSDDGVGFAGDTAFGFGLDGVTARAAEVGGQVRVDTTPGRGTVVTVEVPG